jgi:hypothetical protein
MADEREPRHGRADPGDAATHASQGGDDDILAGHLLDPPEPLPDILELELRRLRLRVITGGKTPE